MKILKKIKRRFHNLVPFLSKIRFFPFLAVWLAIFLRTGIGLALDAGGTEQWGVPTDKSNTVEQFLPNNLIRIRIQAVVTSDDDGGNPATIKPCQIQRWVAEANLSLQYSKSGIVLDFDPQKDLSYLKNTALNNLNNGGSSDAENQANALGGNYPGKILVIFRGHDAGGNLGNGFSGIQRGFIAMPGNPANSTVNTELKDLEGQESYANEKTNLVSGTKPDLPGCDLEDPHGKEVGSFAGPSGNSDAFSSSGNSATEWNASMTSVQNFAQLVHDVGHYLGLAHTFPGSSDMIGTTEGLMQFLAKNHLDFSLLDADAGFNFASDPQAALFEVHDTPMDIGAGIFLANHWNPCQPPKNGPPSEISVAIPLALGKVSLVLQPNGPDLALSLFMDGRQTNNVILKPDRGNVMSYFLCERPMHFSPEQVQVMRRTLLSDPRRQHLVCENPDDIAQAPWQEYCNKVSFKRKWP